MNVTLREITSETVRAVTKLGEPGPFYIGLGFEPNGEVDEGEIVLIYPLG